jgi:hypothetical protein
MHELFCRLAAGSRAGAAAVNRKPEIDNPPGILAADVPLRIGAFRPSLFFLIPILGLL